MVTDRAITDTITELAPKTVLDIGCGEGWLVRALAGAGMQVTGTDAVAELIDKARAAGGGTFEQIAYEQLAYEELSASRFSKRFDLAVCNFSLLGKESVEQVFTAVPDLLNPGGHFVVQTLHPVTSNIDRVYEDGWREGSWAGFSDDFTDPAPGISVP
ncbi:class I SAM-dependent methyltransferase [Aliamphritea spongicola]|nr:class I SAM-dependent methyltransferase [Aliamphritea spongicola]